ncbi:MAG: general secretion pathway protein GspB [Candidatus Omnitrophica bacterium]|nr:general secretion pathway protein GspB [Candidatus Omnitrophota bacterium]
MIKFALLCFFLVISFVAGAFDYPHTTLSSRDPFYPLINEKGEITIREEKGIGDIMLQGIIYLPEGSSVIIDNRMFGEGDSFEKYKIKKIEERGIILENDGKEYFLKWEG